MGSARYRNDLSKEMELIWAMHPAAVKILAATDAVYFITLFIVAACAAPSLSPNPFASYGVDSVFVLSL